MLNRIVVVQVSNSFTERIETTGVEKRFEVDFKKINEKTKRYDDL
jgi:hypothetical protein